MHNLKELLIHEIKDLHNAEHQILEALEKMMDIVSSSELCDALADHHKETKEHIKRLDKICKELNIKMKEEHCDGMEGLIKEGEKIISEEDKNAVLDAALIGAAQKVEHYEIAAYGTAISLARLLEEHEVVKLLLETLREEQAMDKKLTDIAILSVNEKAAELKAGK